MADAPGFRIVYNRLPELAAVSLTAADNAARAMAFAIQARWAQHVLSYPAVDTGAYLNSGYVRTAFDNGEGRAMAAARALQPDVRFGVAEEITMPVGSAGFFIAVEYGICVEMGSIHVRRTSRMSTRKSGLTAQRVRDRAYGTYTQARPSLEPAVEEVRPFVNEYVARALALEGF